MADPLTAKARPRGDNPKWQYGDAGDRWPVQPGDVWQVGPHLFACGDLELHDGERFHEFWRVHLHVEAALGYVDPPWNAGNATSFRTKAGGDRRADFPALRRAVVEVMLLATPLAFCEMGHREANDFLLQVGMSGGKVLGSWDINEPPNKFSCTLTAFQESRDQLAALRAPRNGERALTGLETPGWAVEHHTRMGDYVFDCCVGRGLTATESVRLGRRALGLELNPRRLAVALDKLHELGEGTPRRVGSLD